MVPGAPNRLSVATNPSRSGPSTRQGWHFQRLLGGPCSPSDAADHQFYCAKHPVVCSSAPVGNAPWSRAIVANVLAAGHFRTLARRPVSLTATLTANGEEWVEEVNVVDIGLGGAGLLLRRPIVAGTSVRLAMISPNLWDPLVVPGSVRWAWRSDERGVTRLGIRFEPTSGRQVRALADLVASTAYE